MDDRIIVLFITMTASFLTWKMVKDFYSTKFHMLFAHIIAIITASFMFLSTMILFVPSNFKRGESADVEFTAASFFIVSLMLMTIFFFFTYLPGRKKR
ncbi:MAG: hypothetical protein HRT42_06960 [Campylobacteraceae bacterium]|nr:hypothetical protein [Campylobacteraceae bacterium]